MFTIDKQNKIRITKGDNAEIDMRVFNKDGEEVEILPTDIITLTVRKTASSQVVIQKVADLNSIYLVPEDTKDLEPGLMVYDIDFQRDLERQTIIPLSFFEILEEI